MKNYKLNFRIFANWTLSCRTIWILDLSLIRISRYELSKFLFFSFVVHKYSVNIPPINSSASSANYHFVFLRYLDCHSPNISRSPWFISHLTLIIHIVVHLCVYMVSGQPRCEIPVSLFFYLSPSTLAADRPQTWRSPMNLPVDIVSYICSS